MPTPVTFNGVVYQVPVQGDLGWGPALTRYLVAIAAGAITPSGGSYPLTADLNFGSSFGLVAPYYKSSSANISTAGVLRLSNTDSIGWRNFANSGNLLLGVNTSDQLTFNGSAIQPAITLLNGEIWIGNASNLPIGRTLSGAITTTNTGVTSISSNYITNVMVNSAAAIAYSKLNLAGSILNTDIFSGAAIDATKIANGSVSSTEFQYLDGVTSSIQTQLDSKQATGNYITALTGDVTATGPGSVAATLATVNGNVGSFGSSTSIPSFTVNAKGLITAASGNVVIAPAGTLSGTTLNGTVVSSSLTSIGTITSGVWNGTAITVANGGTGDTSLTAYAVLTGGTTSTGPVQSIASVGTSGQVLTSNGAGALPTFQTATGTGTVNAGTANHVAYYATSTNAVSSATNVTLNAAGYLIGSIVQIVQATDTTATTSVGTAFTSTNLTATITPKATTHKVKISVTGRGNDTNINAVNVYFSIFNGSTDLSNGNGFTGIDGATVVNIEVPVAMVYLDSPATTSATTYTVKVKSTSAASGAWNNAGGTCVILLEEIAQ